METSLGNQKTLVDCFVLGVQFADGYDSEYEDEENDISEFEMMLRVSVSIPRNEIKSISKLPFIDDENGTRYYRKDRKYQYFYVSLKEKSFEFGHLQQLFAENGGMKTFFTEEFKKKTLIGFIHPLKQYPMHSLIQKRKLEPIAINWSDIRNIFNVSFYVKEAYIFPSEHVCSVLENVPRYKQMVHKTNYIIAVLGKINKDTETEKLVFTIPLSKTESKTFNNMIDLSNFKRVTENSFVIVDREGSSPLKLGRYYIFFLRQYWKDESSYSRKDLSHQIIAMWDSVANGNTQINEFWREKKHHFGNEIVQFIEDENEMFDIEEYSGDVIV